MIAMRIEDTNTLEEVLDRLGLSDEAMASTSDGSLKVIMKSSCLEPIVTDELDYEHVQYTTHPN